YSGRSPGPPLPGARPRIRLPAPVNHRHNCPVLGWSGACSGGVELPVLNSCNERIPFCGGEGELRTLRVLGIAQQVQQILVGLMEHASRVMSRGDFDATAAVAAAVTSLAPHSDLDATAAVAAAVTGLTPPHGCEVHLFAASSSRVIEALLGSASVPKVVHLAMSVATSSASCTIWPCTADSW